MYQLSYQREEQDFERTFFYKMNCELNKNR